MNNPDNVLISFSGGRTSAFMTLELLKDEKYSDAIVVFSNTGKENEATLDFVNDVSRHLNNRVVWLEYIAEKPGYRIVTYETASRNGEPFAELIRRRKYCPNRVARFCTQELKIRPMKKYCQQVQKWKTWVNMVGIRYDEPHRWSKSKSVERNEVFDVEHPLVRWKITKPQVLDFWKAMPFNLNLLEHQGNCDLCFLKGKQKKQFIARESPEKFDWWIAMEKEINGRFVERYSYEELLEQVQNAPLIPFDDSIDCFCNID